MDSYSLLPSHNIKLEPAWETDDVHSSSKDMSTEVQSFDIEDSKFPASIKIEKTEVDMEFPDQEMLTCSQNVPSLPVQEHSQMEKMMYSNMDFVKPELTNVLHENNSHSSVKLVDIAECNSDHEMTGHSNTESRMAQNCYEASQEHENCSHISENVTSMFGVNPQISVTDKNCRLQNIVGMKTGDKPYMSDVCHPTFSADSYLEMLTCSQNVSSLPVQEHSLMEKMMYSSMDFVKPELTNVLHENNSHRSVKLVDIAECNSGHEMTGHSNTQSRMAQNCYEASQEHENCSHISENVTSMFGVNPQISVTDKNCQLQNNVGMKTAYMSDVCHPTISADSYLGKDNRKYTKEKVFMCDFCGVFSTSASNLNHHKRKHTGEKHYKCDKCGASFAQVGSLKCHKRTHTGEKPYKCDECGASFANSGSLYNHKRTHTGEKPYKCVECGASFAQVGQLKCHKRTHTGEKPYKCDECGASFARVGQLKCHKRTHTGEKPYKCDECGASFAHSNSLYNHKRTHTGEKPYKCVECGASFAHVSSLNLHKIKHTGEKPYKCDECGASFARVGSLNCHKIKHTGEKPYKCDECGASFTEAGSLKRHKRIHTGERSYKCDDCVASFAEIAHLKRHKKTHRRETL